MVVTGKEHQAPPSADGCQDAEGSANLSLTFFTLYKAFLNCFVM